MATSEIFNLNQYKVQFELGKLHADRGDFYQAIPHLVDAAKGFLAEKMGRSYLDCQNLLLKIYVETEDPKADSLKEEIQDLALKGQIDLDAKAFYTLAYCASHKGQQEDALDYLEKSITLAKAAGDTQDLANAVFGKASAYSRLLPPQNDKAIESLKNLADLADGPQFVEVRISALMLWAHLALAEGKPEVALEYCLGAQSLLTKAQNMINSVFILGMLGRCYLDMDDIKSARLYFTLAARSIDRQNFKRMSKMLEHFEKRLDLGRTSEYDLILDFVNHRVTEKKKGLVDLRNQYTLIELLKLFGSQPGKIFSKEQLVESVWKQTYNPATHDNKVYVTIRRLRRFIEPNHEQPRYIIRAKDGYFLNSSTRLSIDHSNEGG